MQKRHIKAVIIKIFLSFIEHLKRSPKKLASNLLKTLKNDVSSTTGSNLRNIMLIVGKTDIEDLNPLDAENIEYCAVNGENQWKIDVAKELIEVRSGTLQLDNFSFKEVEQMLSITCTS